MMIALEHNIPTAASSGQSSHVQAHPEQASHESCPCGAPYAPQAAFCLRCGTPRRGASAPIAPPQAWPGGMNPALAYGSMPGPFDQVAPPAATGPPWVQGPGGGQPYGMPPYGMPPYGMPAAWQTGMYDQAQWSARREEWQPWSARAPEQLQTQATHTMINQDAMGTHPVMPGPYGSSMHPQNMQSHVKERNEKKARLWSRIKSGCHCRSLNLSHRCLCFSKVRNAMAKRCSRCTLELSKPRWQLALVASVGVAAMVSLLVALMDNPPHLMAAGLAAVVGWLTCYVYILQRDVMRSAYSGSAKAGASVDIDSVTVETMGGTDLDVTGLARHLGSPFAANSCAVLSQRGKGKAGQTMQAVLTSALVKEYLRCSDQLQKYQQKHGILPNAPLCTPGFAEALRSGLNGSSTSTIMKVASPSRAAVRKASPERFTPSLASGFGGTPNFETRFPPLEADSLQGGTACDGIEAPSPAVVHTTPYAESPNIASNFQETSPVRVGANPFGNNASSSSHVPSAYYSPSSEVAPPYNASSLPSAYYSPSSEVAPPYSASPSSQVPFGSRAPSSEVAPPSGTVESCRTIYQTTASYGQSFAHAPEVQE